MTLRLPLTVWFAVNVLVPSVAKGEQANGNAISAWFAGQRFGAMLSVPLVVIGFEEAVSPDPAVMLVTVPLPAPGNVCPGAKVTKPSNIAVPLTSNVAPGVGVPMPTLVLAVAPFTPAMLPSTRALLAPTAAFAPMAEWYDYWFEPNGLENQHGGDDPTLDALAKQGEASLSPAAYSLIADYMPREQLATAIMPPNSTRMG